MAGVRRLALPLTLLLFLVLPGHPLAWVGGLPWGPLALACAVMLAIGIFAAWPLPAGRPALIAALVVVALALLKLGLALAAPRYGLEARYYTNDRFRGEPEVSTAARARDYTRLDLAFDFGSDEFPLYFFNDSERFHADGPDRQDRAKALTWSARWSGFLNVERDGPVTIWLTASGPGELALNGRPLIEVDADGRATDAATVALSPGPHQLQVRYARKKERSGQLRLETDLGGERAVLAAPLVAAERYGPDRLALDRLAATAARGVDALFLGLLAGSILAFWGRRLFAGPAAPERRRVGWERALLAIVLIGFYLQAALPRLDRVAKMSFLGGGQDWLTHETLARDILLNGPLMTLGAPLGEGALYYAQPFYPYYLALLHLLSGEDLYGVITLQAASLGLAAVLVYYLARTVFGRPTGLVALVLMLGVLVPFELAWVARLLLSEALYFWLMPAAVLALLWLRERPGPVRATLAGLLLGLACVTRGPTLLYLPPAALLLWRGLRRAGLPPRQVLALLALLGCAAGLIVGLVPLRNAIVAGEPALTAASGGVNLEKFHRPSSSVGLRNIDEDPFQRLIEVDRPTREVIEYVRQDPLGYLAACLPLAAYTLGVGSALNDLLDERPVQLHPGLLLLNGLYLLAIGLDPRARGLRAGFLHAFVAVHFLTMVVFAPYDYENRLALPLYLFVTPIAAAAPVRVWALLRAARGRSRPAAEPAREASGSGLDLAQT